MYTTYRNFIQLKLSLQGLSYTNIVLEDPWSLSDRSLIGEQQLSCEIARNIACGRVDILSCQAIFRKISQDNCFLIQQIDNTTKKILKKSAELKFKKKNTEWKHVSSSSSRFCMFHFRISVLTDTQT